MWTRTNIYEWRGTLTSGHAGLITFLVLWIVLHFYNHHLLYNPDLLPQKEHTFFFKNQITDCSSTEWNVPCTNCEVTDNVETEQRCLKVRGSQQLASVFKHWGQYKRSSLPTTHSPPGISVEMIFLPASVRWGFLNTGRVAFLHCHRTE